MIGEPAYEVGALMRNPFGVASWPNLQQRWRAGRTSLADELGFDRQRILGWSMAQAVLSGWWTYEDSGRYDATWLAIAEALSGLVDSAVDEHDNRRNNEEMMG